MTAKDAIKIALTGTKEMFNWYVGDLSDQDFLVRPAPTANHMAWQIGHLIEAEIKLLSQVPGSSYPALPANFSQQHSKETSGKDTGFAKKEEYVSLFNQVRDATLKTLDKLQDSDLDKPTTGQMAKFAPTLGALILLQSNHTLMHAGQFTVVRRKQGKPVLF